MPTDREQQLEQALAQFLKPIKGLPFDVIIRALCGVSVEKFDVTRHDNARYLGTITQAVRDVCARVRAQPIRRPRPNEVGNDMEPLMIEALHHHHLVASAPKTKAGKGKSTGYPDIYIQTDGLPIYLEVKTYAAANHDTTQRSFYLSPSEDPKVHADGYHVLVAFEIERKGTAYFPVAYEIVDLYGLECDMKAEFNSDNRRLYSPQRVLAKGRV